MSDNLHSLLKEHQAFYEVSPYYIRLEERPVDIPAISRTIQAGFDVDIYGVNTRNQLAPPAPDSPYSLGYAGLQVIAEKVLPQTSDNCSIEVISFPSTAILDTKDHANVEATIRIRISHSRGLDQPAGPPEQRVLDELENQLKTLGLTRR